MIDPETFVCEFCLEPPETCDCDGFTTAHLAPLAEVLRRRRPLQPAADTITTFKRSA